MSLHYLIDGYNVLYAMPELPAGSWDVKRETLLRNLLTLKPYGKNRVTVVFDSREGGGTRSHHGEIEVVYTAGETADDWLAKHVRETRNAREMVVVSDDKGIRDMIRGTGARWLSAHDFWRQARTSPSRPASRGPEIDSDSITDEFRKKWL